MGTAESSVEAPSETEDDGSAALYGRERPAIIFAPYEGAGVEGNRVVAEAGTTQGLAGDDWECLNQG